MIIYLFKSTLILGILYFFYLLVLEREQVHLFKRFYLLGAVCLALIIPILTFTQYVEGIPVISGSSIAMASVDKSDAISEAVSIWSVYNILYIIYSIGVIIMAARFLKNLNAFRVRINNHPVIQKDKYNYVLLGKSIIPHTFWNFIFLSKEAYEKKQIPKEVLLHEQAHVRQYHSLDLLYIELFQVIFWFQPFLYLFRKNIRLNHEFLADRAVLQKGIPLKTYQHSLLDFSSTSSVSRMAHSINYSSIKKRLTVMQSNTSTRPSWLKSLLVLPMVLFLAYGFSNKTTVYVPNSKVDNVLVMPSEVQENKLSINIQEGNITVNEKPSSLKTFRRDIDQITKNWSDQDYNNQRPNIKIYNTPSDVLKELDIEYKKTKISVRNGGLGLLPPPPPPARKAPRAENPATPAAPKAVSYYSEDGKVMTAVMAPKAPIAPKAPRVAESRPPKPPVAPSPPIPLDHVVELAKQGASFYYEGKSITSDEAISLLKKNEHLNIRVTDHNSKRKVSITKNQKRP